MGVVAVLLAGALIAPISHTEPVYPPRANTGGAVFALLTVSSGSVTRVEILGGQPPFTTSARDALRLWRFPAALRQARIPVVVVYASPRLVAAEGPGVHLFGGGDERPTADAAAPRRVTEPAYPVRGAGGGSAILVLEVGADGAVAEATPVGPDDAFTQAALAAVRAWRFTPRGAGAQAVAVAVFRPPVLPPAAPR